MGYLHAKGIILKNLCSKNVYLEAKVKISMVNYGTCRRYHDRPNYGSVPRGHLTYLAPELMSSMVVEPPNLVPYAPFTKETDVYAYGLANSFFNRLYKLMYEL